MWRSLHIFLHDPAQLEAFLLKVVLPSAAKLPEPAQRTLFFIRYWLDGPHLRVRLRLDGPNDADAFVAELRNQVEAYRAAQPTAIRYPVGARFDTINQADAQRPWRRDGTVADLAYEPEVGRYGGPAALTLAECLFAQSSRLAAIVMAAAPGAITARLGLAAMLAAVGVATASTDRRSARTMLRAIAAGWNDYLPPERPTELQLPTLHVANCVELIDAIHRGEPPTAGALGGWSRTLATYCGALDRLGTTGKLAHPVAGLRISSADDRTFAIASIIASQIHMLNNRLGIPIAFEYAFAASVAPSLTDII